jgi:hypothetical protein
MKQIKTQGLFPEGNEISRCSLAGLKLYRSRFHRLTVADKTIFLSRINMILRIYTIFHVIISLLGIFSGFVVIYGLHTADPLNGWTAFFLATTVATSVTGFFFPFQRLMPSHIVGIISLVVLAPAIYGRYYAHLDGAWRWIYVVGAVLAQYLNFFVLIVQCFQKISPLKALAPTQKEPPFVVTQLFFLIVFVVLVVVAVIKFHV